MRGSARRADCHHDTRGLYPQYKRRIATNIPTAQTNDLVPVADTGGTNEHHDLVRRRTSWRHHFKHPRFTAVSLDAHSAHLSHREDLRKGNLLPIMSAQRKTATSRQTNG